MSDLEFLVEFTRNQCPILINPNRILGLESFGDRAVIFFDSWKDNTVTVDQTVSEVRDILNAWLNPADFAEMPTMEEFAKTVESLDKRDWMYRGSFEDNGASRYISDEFYD